MFAATLVGAAATLGSFACGSGKADCPSQIPISSKCTDNSRSSCDYRLPCGETATCLCIVDDSGGAYTCGSYGPDAGPSQITWPVSLDGYVCAACPSTASIQSCIAARSVLLTPPL